MRELNDDIEAITEFALIAEDLGFTHLRIPDQVIRPQSAYAHEPLMLLAYIAAVTRRIELVPSVIVTPLRQTVLLAKQVAELDVLSGGRVRLGIGVGSSEAEYRALGQDFSTRGSRADEQMVLLKQLWTQPTVEFAGKWHQIEGLGIHPLPVQRPIPLWIGARSIPSAAIRTRIGRHADGWFVLASPDEFDDIKGEIDLIAKQAGRDPRDIGTEAGIAVVGPRQAEWKTRLQGWRRKGLTHVCLRTLGGGLNAKEHLSKLRQTAAELERLQLA
ncbi:MAG: LLM class F420-dependent oxidoreductase [Gammaproteobacteria bacterium]|nr:LLM class F420-dependent oxidoreductase [Gammaproteobacteria bacterium]